VFEKRVLRKIFGPKREEVAGGWRKLHNEPHNLYASPNIIKVIKSSRFTYVGHLARMEEMRNAYKISAGKPAEKRSQGRPRHRWVDNISGKVVPVL
jgi:hypothetical protein